GIAGRTTETLHSATRRCQCGHTRDFTHRNRTGSKSMSSHSRLSRRHLLAGAAGTLALATSGRAVAQTAKPNIVFILADDLGYADVSCYGRPDLSTPNIDRIAANGLRFLQAYANSAVCSATRTALITGRYQYRLRLGLEEPVTVANTSNVGLP